MWRGRDEQVGRALHGLGKGLDALLDRSRQSLAQLHPELPVEVVRIHGDQLIALPGVRQTRTFFVMKEVVDNAPLEF